MGSGKAGIGVGAGAGVGSGPIGDPTCALTPTLVPVPTPTLLHVHRSDEGAIGQQVPLPARPALAAAIVGAVGVAFPTVLFNGYATLNNLLAGGRV